MAALGGPVSAGPGACGRPLPFDKVLFDTRYAPGRSFGAAAARAGFSVTSFDGDLTGLWIRDVKPHWDASAGAICGLTTGTGLFCLEQLAKDHWLRVVARAAVDAAPGRTPLGWADGLLSSLAARRPASVDPHARRAPPPADALVAWVIAKS